MRDGDALGRVGRPGDAAVALASWLVVALRGAAGVVRGLVLRLVPRRLVGDGLVRPARRRTGFARLRRGSLRAEDVRRLLAARLSEHPPQPRDRRAALSYKAGHLDYRAHERRQAFVVGLRDQR